MVFKADCVNSHKEEEDTLYIPLMSMYQSRNGNFRIFNIPQLTYHIIFIYGIYPAHIYLVKYMLYCRQQVVI